MLRLKRASQWETDSEPGDGMPQTVAADSEGSGYISAMDCLPAICEALGSVPNISTSATQKTVTRKEARGTN